MSLIGLKQTLISKIKIITSYKNTRCYFYDDSGCRFPSKRYTCVSCVLCPYAFPSTSTLNNDMSVINTVYSKIQAQKSRLLTSIIIVIGIIGLAINILKMF